MSDDRDQRAKVVPARFRAEPAVGPVGKFMIVVCVLLLAGYVVGRNIVKVPMNPRFDEVERLAKPVVEVVRKYKSAHAGQVPLDLAELLRACHEAGLSGTELPLDPWGRPLIWDPCDVYYHSPYLESFGANGLEGGGRENEDVSIWAGDP